MEILKQGTKPEDSVHTGRCVSCGTEVKFTRSEGRVMFDRRDGNFVTVTCPTCQRPIYSAIRGQ